MEVIISDKNKYVKEINSLIKNSDDKYIIEGKKFVFDIDNKQDICYYAFSENFYDENKNEIDKLDNTKIKIIDNNIYKKFSDTKNAQGVLAVLNKPNITVHDAFDKLSNCKNDTILILDNLQDPGNVGTIIRTFEAVGGSLILTTKGTTSPYSTKCVRSTAGAINYVNIIEKMEKEEIYNCVKENGYGILGTHLDGKITHYDVDFTKKYAIVIGNEGVGMSQYFTDQSDLLIKIPIIGKSESLNASVATAVILYEGLKQKLTNI